MKIRLRYAVLALALGSSACKGDQEKVESRTQAPDVAATNTAPSREAVLEALKKAGIATPDPKDIDYPAGKPPTAQQIALGKALFNDPRLSGSGKIACATCHLSNKAFCDGKARSVGDKGTTLKRHTPHLNNLGWSHVFGWDGEVTTLEDMSLIPFKRDAVMNLPPNKMLQRVQADKHLKKEFAAAFPKESLTVATVGKALAAYQRTIMTRNALLDRYLGGEQSALDAKALRGALLFTGKAKCASCHNGPNLTDESFHNIGVNTDDIGRGKFQDGDMFKFAFKTPGLRNVAMTAPYMHDGSEATLEAVVRFYNVGGKKPGEHDPIIKPLGLSEQEMDDLVAFMNALTETHGKGATDSKASPGDGQQGSNTTGAGDGVVTGQIHFDEKPPKVGLIYFSEDKGLDQGLTIDQDAKQFLKQMAVSSPGETITFKNSASISHNIYANDPHLKVKFDLGLALPESDFSKTQPVSWANGEVLKVGCKIHPNMRVYIASLTSRYYQVFEFNDANTPVELKAPPNLTKITLWLPQSPKVELTLKPGEHKQVMIKGEHGSAGTLTLDRK